MPLKEELTNDLKDAMRQRDTVKRDTIRLLLSAIGYEEKAKRTDVLEDDAVLQVLSKQAQQRRDSIEAYEKGNRPRPRGEGRGRTRDCYTIPAAATGRG